MATTLFQITPYSSFNLMRDGYTIDDRYHTVPFADRQDPTKYFQKIQQDDTNFRVQLLSDFTPTLRLYDCDDLFVKNVSFTSRAILNASYLVYDAVVDWRDVTEGVYYLKLTYTDEHDVVQTYRTYMLYVTPDWDTTLLLEYTNTFNDKGVIFVNNDNSLLTFAFRIEASFDEYQPLSDDIDYIDQVHDSEVLNNTPFDNHKLYIGTDQFTGGAPDWAIKKMNLIFSLNKVRIDNQYYNRVEGSKFTAERADHGVMINGENVRVVHWSIDIIPNENLNLGQLKTDDVPTGDLIVIKKAKIYDSISADFTAAGIFTVNSNLIRIAIENKNFDVFTLLVGTTDGGSEIATIDVVNNPDTGTPDLTSSHDIGHVFATPTDIFITGITGTNLKVTLDWNQYDSPVLNPTVTTGGIPAGVGCIYHGRTTGAFALDFDIATGLGLRGYVGWALSDGRNGTVNRAGKYSVGWDRTLPLTRGTVVGANTITLAKAQLPAVGIPMFDTAVNTTRGDTPTPDSNVARANNSSTGIYLDYEMSKGTPGVEPTLGLTAKLGAGNPINIQPSSLIDVWIEKITD